MADREADIYDLFATPRRPRVDLLIRGIHNRMVNCKDDADSPDSTPNFEALNRKRSPLNAPFGEEIELNNITNWRNQHLWDAIHKSPIKGELTVQLQRANDRPPRQAVLTIRYKTLEILPPKNRKHTPSLKPIPVQVVLAEEKNPPPGDRFAESLLLFSSVVSLIIYGFICVSH